MAALYYDFHIHSCLSPCGDEDMTPNNIVNMALLKGLDWIALTDHCTCKNCEATAEIARAQGLAFLPGMELTTAEEIHVVCLFGSLRDALAFDYYVELRLPPIKNKPHIFGEQRICNSKDEVIGTVEKLLINATSIGISEVQGLMKQFHGIVFPAHIEKPSNSILAMLGFIPDEYGFSVVECNHRERLVAYQGGEAILEHRLVLQNSDAHQLEDICEREHSLELEAPDFALLQGYFT